MADIIRDIQEIHIEVDTKQIQQYENAINEFNSLVENGLAIKRGYNIRTIEQSYLLYQNKASNIY